MSLRNLIEIMKVRKASNYEPWWRFKAEFLSPAISARLWFDSWLRHNAFRKPGLRTFRLPYHFIVASQWDGNPTFTVHAGCYIAHAFRAAIKLTQCCYQGCVEGGWTRRLTRTSKAVGHPKSETTKSAFYQNLATRLAVQNFLWKLVVRSNFFSSAHIRHKLCHTAFICMKYKR